MKFRFNVALLPLKAFSLLSLLVFQLFLGCAGGKNITDNNAMANKREIKTLEELRSAIDQNFSDSSFAHAHWGVLIQSLRTGQVWYERNSDRMFNPASNNKIPSASAALVTLGPDFTFKTELCANGMIADSILKGDLVVFGNGDPSLYSHFQKDPRDMFKHWASILKAKGIKHVTGNVIGDDNSFDDNSIGYGWSFDGLDAWYSAEIGPLQLNENYVDLTIIPPKDLSGSVKIEPNIPSSYYKIINRLTVTDKGRNDINVTRAYGTNNILIEGTVVAGTSPVVESPSVFNPTLFYVTVLKEVLQSEGIKIDGSAVDCDDIEGWKHSINDFLILDEHNSPALKEIIKEMMKRSQNLYAETMTRILGLKEYKLGSFKNGKKVVEKVLSGFGIEPGTYQYMDGSGLSRYNYISPRELVKILTSMYKSPYWEVWRDAQPIAGVDGTLKNRMKGTKAEGNVRAKTGTISNVRGLSGYVTTADGEEIVFSFLVNGHLRTSLDTEKITDKALTLIAEFQRDNVNIVKQK